jgi:hypothetical protein
LQRNPSAKLVLAMDNDVTDRKTGLEIPFDQRPGEIMARKVSALAPAGMMITRATPASKDWNQDLQNAVAAQEVARLQALARERQEELARERRGHGHGVER